MHLREFPAINRLTSHRELLFGHAKFLESFLTIESDRILIAFLPYFDLDFESHRHIRAPASQIFRLYQIAHPVRPPGDLL